MKIVYRILALLSFAVCLPAISADLSVGPVTLITDEGLINQSAMDSGGGHLTHTYKGDLGTLFINEGFLPDYVGVSNGTAYDPADSTISPIFLNAYIGFNNITIATLNALTGKTIMPLSQWVSYSNLGMTKGFSRSAETYSVKGVPNVIVSVGGSSGGSSSVTPNITLAAVSNASISTQSSGEFLIALDSATNKNVKVKYQITGTAKNGKDYTKIKKTATILAGNVSTMVEIKPTSKAQAGMSVILILSKPVNKKLYKLGQTTTAEVEINN